MLLIMNKSDCAIEKLKFPRENTVLPGKYPRFFPEFENTRFGTSLALSYTSNDSPIRRKSQHRTEKNSGKIGNQPFESMNVSSPFLFLFQRAWQLVETSCGWTKCKQTDWALLLNQYFIYFDYKRVKCEW